MNSWRSGTTTKKISPQRREATKVHTGKNVVDLCVLRVSVVKKKGQNYTAISTVQTRLLSEDTRILVDKNRPMVWMLVWFPTLRDLHPETGESM